MARERFYELLSSLANCRISERDFEVSVPRAVDGTKSSVMVAPRNKTRRYGFQQVQYNRFNLSDKPVLTLAWRGEGDTHQLVSRVGMVSQFPYRLSANNGTNASVPRRLRLAPEDIVYEPIVVTTNTTHVTLRANEESDFFIGSLQVILTRSS